MLQRVIRGLARRLIEVLRLPLVALTGRLFVAVERYVGRASLVGDAPFFEPATFPWTGRMEAAWPEIRGELDEILAGREVVPNFQDVSPVQRVLTDDDRWKTFFLYAYGYRADANCARCPRTAAVLDSIPGMTTAFFSIMEPGKRIPPHRGPFKGVLRYHLALRIPGDGSSCGLVVAGELRQWREGESLVFDDTFQHEAWNESDDVRVVLFMDFKRPLPRFAARVNDLAIGALRRSAFVKEAVTNLEARVDDAGHRAGPPSS